MRKERNTIIALVIFLFASCSLLDRTLDIGDKYIDTKHDRIMEETKQDIEETEEEINKGLKRIEQKLSDKGESDCKISLIKRGNSYVKRNDCRRGN